MRGEFGDGKPNKTNKIRDARHFDGPQAKISFLNFPPYVFGKRVTLRSGQHIWKILHDKGIGIETAKRRQIRVPPVAQQ